MNAPAGSVSDENSGLVDGCLLAVSSNDLFLCACVERDRALVTHSLLIRTPVLSVEGPTLVISFNRKYLNKTPISKYSHMGVRLRNMNLRVGTEFST